MSGLYHTKVYYSNKNKSVFHKPLIFINNERMKWNEIRERIKQLMREQGFNESTLASDCGMHQPTLWRFLSGESKSLRLDNMERIGKSLEVTISQLIGETPMEPDYRARRTLIAMQNMAPYHAEMIMQNAETLAKIDAFPAPEKKTG